MQDYEILGQFYLGKQYSLAEKALQDAPILYDSQDLTTHALIIGMTGSGKTGLGISLLEEALIDNIPLIAIDPKGDIANLLLTFDELTGDRFLPWIDPQIAATQGLSVEDYAADQAELWEKGLGSWGQDAARIQRLRQQVEMAVYTPGSSAGLPISLLDSFDAPPAEVLEDVELMAERVGATATGLLSLLGIDANPVTSREHILIATLLNDYWNLGQNLDIASLIQAIQAPPMDRIGVMELDQFYPAKDRMALAMQLNNLLASPGFAAWRSGEPLDIQKLLYTPEGKARAAIFSIGHLGDRERMFFVTMLLNQLLGWVRSQSGTSSLRAMLYMDEIMGYLPPVANPPSKKPMLTLLKQARAFGLGLVLATQNPVDLDYKALSNIGTWFIGRLQTERDRARVLEGLQVADGEGFDAAEFQEVLTSLGKRVFLLRNVHETKPVIFQTRWALSYLRGPLTRDQIKQLMATMKAARRAEAKASAVAASPPKTATQTIPAQSEIVQVVDTNNALPEGVEVFYAPAESGLALRPWAIAIAQVHYSSKTYDLDETQTLSFQLPLSDLSDAKALDWSNAQPLALAPSELLPLPPRNTDIQPLPDFAQSAQPYGPWQTELNRHIREAHPLELIKCKSPKLVSQPGEAQTDFLLRVRQKLREERDGALGKIRDRYATKLRNAETKLATAEQKLSREQVQAQQCQIESAVAVGSTLLGAFMGRKITGKGQRAVRAVGRLSQDRLDVEQAQAKAGLMAEDIQRLEGQLQVELAGVEAEYSADKVLFEKVQVVAQSADVELTTFGLLWRPGEA